MKSWQKTLLRKQITELIISELILGYNPITGKQIQKYRSGFRTKKEAKEEYSKLVLASTEELTTKKDGVSFQQFIEETYLPESVSSFV